MNISELILRGFDFSLFICIIGIGDDITVIFFLSLYFVASHVRLQSLDDFLPVFGTGS